MKDVRRRNVAHIIQADARKGSQVKEVEGLRIKLQAGGGFVGGDLGSGDSLAVLRS